MYKKIKLYWENKKRSKFSKKKYEHEIMPRAVWEGFTEGIEVELSLPA